MKNRLLLLTVLSFSTSGGYAGSGPDYLVVEDETDPIIAAFKRLKLPFTRERRGEIHFRSYFLDRDNDAKQQDWAAGGLFEVESVWSDHLTFGTTFFGSYKLIGDNDKGDTGLLKPNHSSYDGVSEAFLQWKSGNFLSKVGRYAFNMPYINRADIRMIPNSFQAASALYNYSERLTVAVGVITDIKTRTSTSFKPLYEVAGLEEDKAIWGAASLWQIFDDLNAGFYFFHAPDFYDNYYLEANKTFTLNPQQQIKLSGQYTHQNATGDKLDNDFTVDHFGLRLSWQFPAITLVSAATYYSETENLRSPWGSIPGYTSVIVKDFNRPGELAYYVGSVLNFSYWGIENLKLDSKYIHGSTDSEDQSVTPDTDEIDVTLSYSVKSGMLEGMQVMLRHAWINYANEHLHQQEDFNDLRLIANYSVSF